MMVTYTDQSIMSWGQYKGQKLANIPASYLLFIYDNFKLNEALKRYIEENKESLLMEKKQATREKYR